jgi:hypothetical protein
MRTPICIAYLALTQFCVVCINTTPGLGRTTPDAPAPQANAEAQLTLSWLARTGISSELLCAAGVDGAQRVALAQAAVTSMRVVRAQLQAADDEMALAREQLRVAQAATGLTVQARREAISAAQLRWRNASGAVEALEQAGREAILAPLSEQLRTLLRTAYANTPRQTPVIYKFQARDDAGWARLERALRAKRAADASNQPVSAYTQQELQPAAHSTFLAGANQRLENLDLFTQGLLSDLAQAALP